MPVSCDDTDDRSNSNKLTSSGNSKHTELRTSEGGIACKLGTSRHVTVTESGLDLDGSEYTLKTKNHCKPTLQSSHNWNPDPGYIQDPQQRGGKESGAKEKSDNHTFIGIDRK